MAKLFIIAPEGGAFLVHVDEDLAEAAIVEFAGAQIDLVAADDRFLGVALAAVRQLFAVVVKPLDDALDDLFGDLRGAGSGRRLDQRLDRIVLLVVIVGRSARR